MALVVDGVTVESAVLNGSSVDELYMDGVLVFQNRSDQPLGLFDGSPEPEWGGTDVAYTEVYSTVGAGCMWVFASTGTLTYDDLDFSKFDRITFDIRGAGTISVYNGLTLLSTKTPTDPNAWGSHIVEVSSANNIGDLKFVNGSGASVYIDNVWGIVF